MKNGLEDSKKLGNHKRSKTESERSMKASKKAVAKAATAAAEGKTAPAKPTVLTGSFEGLGESLITLKLQVPTLASLEVHNVADTVAAKMAAATEIREGVANALKFLFGAEKQLAAVKNGLEKKFLMEEIEEPRKNANDYLDQVLAMKGALKSVAAAAYLRTVLTMTYESSVEVNLMLRSLVERGLLVNSGAGPTVMIGFLHYHLGNFGLDADDVKEIIGVVDQFSNVVKSMERQRRDEMAKEMAAEAKIGLDDALSGKIGTCLVHIPAESFKDRSSGQVKWRGGGDVMFDFQSSSVLMLRASGSVERLVDDIKRNGVKLPKHALNWKSAPGIPGLADSIADNLNMEWNDAEVYAKDLVTIWYMLQRGIKHAKQLKDQAEAVKEMTKKAEITPFQFFGLNGCQGQAVLDKVAFLQFDGVLKLPDQNLFSPFLLAKRGSDDGKDVFEVIEVPLHLETLFGPFVGKRFPVNDQSECPELGDLLARIRGQQEMAASIAAVEK